jgi:hypothetical protein
MYLGPDGKLLPWPAIVTGQLTVKNKETATKETNLFIFYLHSSSVINSNSAMIDEHRFSGYHLLGSRFLYNLPPFLCYCAKAGGNVDASKNLSENEKGFSFG